MPTQRMFRQEALDQMRSPEDLDQLLTVVRRRAWLSVVALGVLCFAGVAWSIFGLIPVTIDGFGVLVNPGNVKGLQATAAGQLVELRARVGQSIRRGDVIAVLNQDSLRKDLRQEEERKLDLVKRNQLARRIGDERAQMDRQSITEQRKSILAEIDRSEQLADRAERQHQAFVDEQTRNLANTKQLMVRLQDARRNQVATVRSLRAEGLTSDDLVIDAEATLTDSELRVADLGVELQQLEMRKVESEQEKLRHQVRVGDLQLKLVDLAAQERRVEQDLEHQESTRQAEIEESQRRIDRIDFQLGRSETIVSEYDGRILELTVSSGQLIAEGTRIGTLELEATGARLANLAYFPVKDGKRIQVDDVIHVTPATVQRERFGSIVGRVARISAFPVTPEGAANLLGSSEIAASLMQPGGAIEVEAELLADPTSVSGFRWTSGGPPIQFSAGTTTTVRVTIERRRPISYVFPILRSWVFGQKDERLTPS